MWTALLFLAACWGDKAYIVDGRVAPNADFVLYGRVAMTRDGKVEIVHNLSVVVMDANGKVIERYPHLDWEIDRVVSQLRTGEPLGL